MATYMSGVVSWIDNLVLDIHCVVRLVFIPHGLEYGIIEYDDESVCFREF